jgi:hypothetical protein
MKLELKIKERRRKNPRLHMLNRQNNPGNFESGESFKCYNVLYMKLRRERNVEE